MKTIVKKLNDFQFVNGKQTSFCWVDNNIIAELITNDSQLTTNMYSWSNGETLKGTQMLINRIIAIIIFCYSMCYASDYSFELENIVTPTNSAKHGIAVEISTAFVDDDSALVDDYSVSVVCRDSIANSFGRFLPVFSVNLILESKAESLSLDVPVQYSREEGYCRVKFMMSRRVAEFSTLHIYYGYSREGYISLCLPLNEWIEAETLGNTKLSSSSNAKDNFSVIERNPVRELKVSDINRKEFYGLKGQEKYPYISGGLEKLFEVDETLRQEDRCYRQH